MSERFLWGLTTLILILFLFLTNHRIDSVKTVTTAQTEAIQAIGKSIIALRDFTVIAEKAMKGLSDVDKKQLELTLKMGEIQGKILEWIDTHASFAEQMGARR